MIMISDTHQAENPINATQPKPRPEILFDFGLILWCHELFASRETVDPDGSNDGLRSCR